MPEIFIFLLLPESTPSNQWMQSTDEIHNEDQLNSYINELNKIFSECSIENYKGFYDHYNIKNFLSDFDILEDYYPQPARRLLLSTISNYYDWRESIVHSPTCDYKIHHQPIKDHTFCEVGQRARNDGNNNCIILNHKAHVLGKQFNIVFENEDTLLISIETQRNIFHWFRDNRIPKRNFHVIPKHGENRQEIRVINGKRVSPLRCSQNHGQLILKSAIGDDIGELFGDDGDQIIVYKYEGNNGQNLYHGYHVNFDSEEVPDSIREKLLSRRKEDNA